MKCTRPTLRPTLSGRALGILQNLTSFKSRYKSRYAFSLCSLTHDGTTFFHIAQQETFKEAHKEGAQLDTVVVVEAVKGEQPAAGDGSKPEEVVYESSTALRGPRGYLSPKKVTSFFKPSLYIDNILNCVIQINRTSPLHLVDTNNDEFVLTKSHDATSIIEDHHLLTDIVLMVHLPCAGLCYGATYACIY